MKKMIKAINEAIRNWIRTKPTKASYSMLVLSWLVITAYIGKFGAHLNAWDLLFVTLAFIGILNQVLLHDRRDKTDRENAVELAQVRQSLNEAVKSIGEWQEIARAQNMRIEELERVRNQNLATINRLSILKDGLLSILWWMFDSMGRSNPRDIVLHSLSGWIADRRHQLERMNLAHEDPTDRFLDELQRMRVSFTEDFETWNKEREERERLQSAIHICNAEWFVGFAHEIFIRVATMNRVKRVQREIRSIQDELVLAVLQALAEMLHLIGELTMFNLQYALGSYEITAEELQRILRDLQTNKGDRFARILEQMPEDVHRFLTAIMANPASVEWPDAGHVDPGPYVNYDEDDF